MSLKSITLKAAISVATIFTITANANAKINYNAGLGWGIGLFKFNDSREDSTFKGDVAEVTAASPLGQGLGAGNAAL